MSSFNKYNFPNEKILRNAHKEFEKLLTRQTTELEWQEFFTAHPYVFSLSLHLRLEPQDIIPLARRGESEPDFIFYPRKLTPPPFYGVIEIKRPDSTIVTIPRSNIAILSRDTATAIEQAKCYGDTVRPAIMKSDNILFLGSELYMFVIMGLTSELKLKLDNSFLQNMIQNEIPRNLHILPYDSLLKRFEQAIPPKLHILVSTHDEKDKEPTDIKKNLLKSVEEIEMSVYSANALRNANIHSLSDLVQMNEEEMIGTKNFSQKSINEIKEILRNFDLELNMKIEKDKKAT
jgi:hypothetical protein